MNDDEKWEAIYNLSEIPKWGYEETSWGKKILAKKIWAEILDFSTTATESPGKKNLLKKNLGGIFGMLSLFPKVAHER